MNARGVAVASGLGLTVTLGIYSMMGSFGGPFETSHSPVPDPLTLNTLKVGVLDAGTVYAHALRNVDAGAVYAPDGLDVDTGESVGFRGPGGDSYIRHTGGALTLYAGSGLKVGTVDGFFTQSEATLGQLSANAVEVSGGALRTRVAVVAGTGGPSADAGIDVVPVGEGVMWVWGAGLRTHTVGNADGGGVLDLRGDVQVDDRRPVVSLDAGTPRQAMAVGCVALVAGSKTVNFDPDFEMDPACVCTDATAANVVKCVGAKTDITITGTGTDTICYNCVEMQ